jgi:NAD(P)-dependent dehydrogenase (short-subunit alcohol dehydrogenase family)
MSRRHIVITGAARGIGRALSQRFLAEGWLVTGIDLGAAALADPAYSHAIADITDKPAFDAALEEAWARAPVSAVIGNAALTDLAHRAAIDLPYADWQRILRVNIDGAFLTGRLAGRRMAAQGHGNIVFVTSSLAFLDQAKAEDAPYCTSKSGVEMLARVLALELGPKGVNVNTLFPSVKIDTGFFAHLSEAERAELAPPSILDPAALWLAGRARGYRGPVSIDQERFDADPAYRTSLTLEETAA